MSRGRSANLKARVAPEAAKGHKKTSEIAQEHQVHPTPISQWKRQLLDSLLELFEADQGRKEPTTEEVTGPPHKEIGQLRMKVSFPGVMRRAKEKPRTSLPEALPEPVLGGATGQPPKGGTGRIGSPWGTS